MLGVMALHAIWRRGLGKLKPLDVKAVPGKFRSPIR
jgi:hypothetical protein